MREVIEVSEDRNPSRHDHSMTVSRDTISADMVKKDGRVMESSCFFVLLSIGSYDHPMMMRRIELNDTNGDEQRRYRVDRALTVSSFATHSITCISPIMFGSVPT